MTHEVVSPVDIEHANAIYQDAVLKLNQLAEMDYESEYARAMALKPYRDLINSFDTAYNDGLKQGKLEYDLGVAKKMIAKGFDIKTIVKITGLTEEVILQ
jgi:predicted transposase/invertase (TIGR01784 family)